MRRLAAAVSLLSLVSCTGTTGGQLVSFYAAAAGPADAHPNYVFVSDLGGAPGYNVSLTKAVMHVAAIYLDESVPISGGGESPCTLPGTYVGEVRPTQGLDVDMLSSAQQLLPMEGIGSTIPAAVAQVWLGGPDVNAPSDPTVVLDIAGTATRTSDGMVFPFAESQITIDASHDAPNPSTLNPGAHPICEQRIVTPIRVDITLSQSGTLVLHLDPKALFQDVDFSNLTATGDPPTLAFEDRGLLDDEPASRSLYANLRSAGAVYSFEWQPASQ